MKTQRRHELQTNTLADWLGHKIENVQPYSKAIVTVVLLVCALGIAYMFISGRGMAEAGAAWKDFFGAVADRDVESLTEVHERHAGKEAGFWALQKVADEELGRGTRLLFRDREQANDALKVARKNYEAVKANAKRGSLLEQRAIFGLAQTLESMGELDDAKKQYKALASAAPESSLGKEAQQRLDSLEEEGTERFYAWFEKQEPKPPVSATGSNMPLDLPRDLTELSDRPDISAFPELSNEPTTNVEPASPAESPTESTATPSADAPATEPATEDKPTEDKPTDSPAPSAEKPTEETPSSEKQAEPSAADEKSADEKPAEEKPSEDKPSEETPADKPKDDQTPSESQKPAAENPSEEGASEEKPADDSASTTSESSADKPAADSDTDDSPSPNESDGETPSANPQPADAP